MIGLVANLSLIFRLVPILLIAAIAGCSDRSAKVASDPRLESTRHQVKDDNPTYLYQGKPFSIVHHGSNDPKLKQARDEEMRRTGVGRANMMSSLHGILKITDGCLVLGSPGGGADSMIMFPGGEYSWDNQTSTLTYGRESFKIGDRVSLGGGTVLSGTAENPAPALPEVFAYNCDVSKYLFFVN